jgi:hypothetical protein
LRFKIEMGERERKRYVWVGVGIFLGALLIRVIADLIFFSRFGWFSSHLIEVWFYYGVARGIFYLSLFDPTYLLLRVPGFLLPSAVLYQATVFLASAVSALTAFLIYGWLRRRYDRPTGIFGGLVFALLPAPITLGLVNFSHDLVAIPLLVLFFRAAGGVERGGEGCGRAVAAALACLFFGLMVGPLMAGALLVVLLYSRWPLFKRLLGRPPDTALCAFFLGELVLVICLLYLVMRPNLLDWIAPLALRFRGIDLSAQMTIQVGDLQPLPPDAFWNRYTIFVFLLPWGLWTAFRKRDFFALTLFLVSFSLALVVNRSARLLDLSVVLLAARALAGWKKTAGLVTAIWILLIFFGNLAVPAAARAVYLAMPLGLKGLLAEVLGVIRGFPVILLRLKDLLAEVLGMIRGFPFVLPAVPARLRFALLFLGFFVLGLFGSLFLRGKKSVVVAILILVAFRQAAWVLEVARTSSNEMEYRVYRRLDEIARPGEKIFAAWNQGYFIGSVTSLVPVTTPERIDLSLSRLYWEEEESAVRELLRRGVSYVHVSSRYFGITSVNERTDTFGMRGSTIIGPRPDHIRRFSRMRRTFLFRMLYEPEKLAYLKPLLQRQDPKNGLLVRIFQLAPFGEP